ncbi:glycosyltransferase family 2 protein [Bacteroides sp.]
MELVKVSVIIPVYNTEPYLEKAVRSILNQTLTELEIIAVNDGSTDKSLEILEQLQKADARLHIYSQPNQGLSVTRNIGMSKANGEYIYFFDSDDFLREDALANCYRTATEYKCDFVFFDAVIMDDPNPEHSAVLPYQRKNLLKPDYVYTGAEAWKQLQAHKRNSTSVCLNMIRAHYLRSHHLSFYPGILHEDHLFTFLLYLQADKVCYIPEDYFHRRVRQHSIMTSPVSMRNIDGCLVVCRELTQYDRFHPQLSKTDRTLIHQEVESLVNIIASTSMPLSFGNRMKILKRLLSGYAGKLMPASILLLLFPFLKLKKRH